MYRIVLHRIAGYRIVLDAVVCWTFSVQRMCNSSREGGAVAVVGVAASECIHEFNGFGTAAFVALGRIDGYMHACARGMKK